MMILPLGKEALSRTDRAPGSPATRPYLLELLPVSSELRQRHSTPATGALMKLQFHGLKILSFGWTLIVDMFPRRRVLDHRNKLTTLIAVDLISFEHWCGSFAR